MIRGYYIQLILFLFLFSCTERFTIPFDIGSQDSGEFGAGDTVFLELKPLWNSSYGFNQPEEISVAQDGRIFVADKGNNSIIVLDQDGDIPVGFESLISLKDEEANFISPIDVDIDKKMNVFFIDGSQKIFNWNQYWNEVGINKILVSA